MKKIAIVLEGQTEYILVRELLPILFGWDKVSFECVRLISGKEHTVPYKYETPNPDLFCCQARHKPVNCCSA